MTTRNDLIFDLQTSPRVAEVADPSAEINMQDLVDTFRIQEESFSNGLSYSKLLNASGKEPLGGGVFVGITVAMQDTLLSFEARTSPAESGTVTTGSGAPIAGTITFEDTSADFSAAGVVRGSLVINFTDQSIADVVEVVNSTTLKTKVLVNGIGNTYDISDVYHVFNIVQCQVEGGNLTAVDSDDLDIDPILPTAFTQVIRTSSSSATLSEQQDIQYASFNGGVTIDVTSGNTGTTFPTGTPRMPINNLAEAFTILDTRGFHTYFVIGDLTIDMGTHPYIFIGESIVLTTLTLDTASDILDAEFRNATVTGTLDGNATIKDCRAQDLTMISGILESCLLGGTITLGGGNDAFILDCWSGVADTALPPIIDMGGSGQGLALRNYNGGLKIVNKSGSDDVSVDLASGQIILASTVTGGTITIRGVGKLTDESGDPIPSGMWNGATIINELLTTMIDGESFETVMRKLKAWGYGRFVETSDGVFDYYAEDGVTKLFTLTATEAGGLVERTVS